MDNKYSSETSLLSRKLLLLMAVSCGMAVANLYYNQTLLQDIARAFQASAARVNIVAMITQIGYALGLLFLVPLGDRFNRRIIILTQAGVLIMGLLLAGAAPNLTTLIIASLLIGISATLAQQIIPFVAQLARPEARGKSLGIAMSGLLSGILLARVISGYVGTHWGWREMFILAAGAIFVLLLVLYKYLPSSVNSTSLSYAELMRSLWRLLCEEPVLRAAALSGGLTFCALSVFWSTMVYYVTSDVYRLTGETVGMLALVGIIGVWAAPYVGRLADKYGVNTSLNCGFALSLTACLIFLFAGHKMAGLILGVLLIDIGAQGTSISNQSRIFSLQPQARSRLNSVYMVGYFTGGAMGSWLGSIAWLYAGWSGVSITALLSICLALAHHLIFVVARRWG